MIQLNPVDDYIDELLDWAHKDWNYRRMCLKEAISLGSADAELLLAISDFHHHIILNDDLNYDDTRRQSLATVFSISPDSDFFNKKWEHNGVFSILHDNFRQPFDSLVDSHPIALGYIGRILLEIGSFQQADNYFEVCYEDTLYNDDRAVLDAIPFNILSAMYYYGLYAWQYYRLAVRWACRGSCLGDAMSCFILG